MISTTTVIPSSSTAALEVNTTQQIRQLRVGQFDSLLAALEIRKLKSASLQSLIKNAESVAIPEEDLDAVATTVEKQEQVSRQGILIKDRFRLTHQVIEAVAHLRGRRAEEDSNV